MKKTTIMLFGLILALSCASSRDLAGQERPGGPLGAMDKDSDGKISRSEWENFHRKIIEEFSEIDRNSDSYLEPGELRDHHMKKMRERKGPMPPMHGITGPGFRGKGPFRPGMMKGGPPINKMDTNNDGRVSRAEWDSHHGDMFNKLDRNDNRVIEPEELRAHHMKMRGPSR